ncbi:fimbrial protein [Serratia marcescens]|uniref:fimbrial protein n=1 Tax=Serratia marcescens TaxID=615 RepID=UPI003988CF7C
MYKFVVGFNRLYYFLLALCVSPVIGWAAVVPVNINVTVVAVPCVINDDKPIEVDFGNVLTTRVDGVNYRMPVNYTLSCPGGEDKALKLQVQGAPAAFDGKSLQTSVTALGIELQQGSHAISVNDWVNFTYPNKPELWVVPVKQPGATLPAGDFTAAASMKVDYQ